MLSGRRKKDYAVESAADALVAQAAKMGVEPADADAALAEASADAYGETAEDEAEAVAA